MKVERFVSDSMKDWAQMWKCLLKLCKNECNKWKENFIEWAQKMVNFDRNNYIYIDIICTNVVATLINHWWFVWNGIYEFCCPILNWILYDIYIIVET